MGISKQMVDLKAGVVELKAARDAAVDETYAALIWLGDPAAPYGRLETALSLLSPPPGLARM